MQSVGERVFEPGSISYDTIAATYRAARALSVESAATWSAVLAPFIPSSRRGTVLDLGCGTGRFSSLIAERFQTEVVGLDPSLGMVQAATRNVKSGNLSYAVADAGHLPLAAASCDVVLLSQVIHHIADRPGCARELRRIIGPEGHVLIRGAFGDRLESCPTYFKFFPGARRIMSQLPTIREILTIFRNEGFRISGFQSIPQKTCGSLRELAERTRHRADSTLVLLSDSEFERSQAALDYEARRETVPEPVIETVDLLVFRPR